MEISALLHGSTIIRFQAPRGLKIWSRFSGRTRITRSVLMGKTGSHVVPVRGGRHIRLALTYFHTDCMVFHMKTTLNIDDTVMKRLRQEAARTGRTMSELVESALRQLLESRSEPAEVRPLPSFDSGGALVDISDRETLYQAMEGR